MIKKLISLLLVVVFLIPNIAIADSVFPESELDLQENVTIEEYDKLISKMLEVVEDIEVNLDSEIKIPVKSGRLSGTVIIEENKDLSVVDESIIRPFHLIDDIPNGNRILTTTLKADVLLGGEMILKTHYTMKSDGMDARYATASFSPPFTYTDGGSSAYIAEQDNYYFKSKGSYTMKSFDLVPLTIKVVQSVTWLTEGTISVNSYKEL